MYLKMGIRAGTVLFPQCTAETRLMELIFKIYKISTIFTIFKNNNINTNNKNVICICLYVCMCFFCSLF